MSLLCLQRNRWYAMDLYLAINGRRHASPIWISDIIPLKTGKAELELRFWHANYTEGVQNKRCILRVLQRAEGFILALEPGGELPPVLVLTELTSDWLELNFPQLAPTRSVADLQGWCDDEFGRPGHLAHQH